MLTTDLIGEVELNKRILNLIRAIPDEIADAMVADGEEVLKLALTYTPEKTGNLKISGRVGEPEVGGRRWPGHAVHGHEISVPIIFGSEKVNYAIYVHENLEARHYPPYGKGGQAKFLDRATKESAPGKSTRIAKRIKLERLI